MVGEFDPAGVAGGGENLDAAIERAQQKELERRQRERGAMILAKIDRAPSGGLVSEAEKTALAQGGLNDAEMDAIEARIGDIDPAGSPMAGVFNVDPAGEASGGEVTDLAGEAGREGDPAGEPGAEDLRGARERTDEEMQQMLRAAREEGMRMAQLDIARILNGRSIEQCLADMTRDEEKLKAEIAHMESVIYFDADLKARNLKHIAEAKGDLGSMSAKRQKIEALGMGAAAAERQMMAMHGYGGPAAGGDLGFGNPDPAGMPGGGEGDPAGEPGEGGEPTGEGDPAGVPGGTPPVTSAGYRGMTGEGDPAGAPGAEDFEDPAGMPGGDEGDPAGEAGGGEPTGEGDPAGEPGEGGEGGDGGEGGEDDPHTRRARRAYERSRGRASLKRKVIGWVLAGIVMLSLATGGIYHHHDDISGAFNGTKTEQAGEQASGEQDGIKVDENGDVWVDLAETPADTATILEQVAAREGLNFEEFDLQEIGGSLYAGFMEREGSQEMKNGVRANYTDEYANYGEKRTHNSFGVSREGLYDLTEGREEATVESMVEICRDQPETLAATVANYPTLLRACGVSEDIVNEADVLKRSQAVLELMTEDEDGARLQERLLGGLSVLLTRDEGYVSFNYYLENGTEKTYYMDVEDDSLGEKPGNIELKLDTAKRTNAKQVQIMVTYEDGHQESGDYNLFCGFQTNLEVADNTSREPIVTPEDTPAEETPEDETPEDETPEDETPEDETPEDETPEDETPEDETPGEEVAPKNEQAEIDNATEGITGTLDDGELGELTDEEVAIPQDRVEVDEETGNTIVTPPEVVVEEGQVADETLTPEQQAAAAEAQEEANATEDTTPMTRDEWAAYFEGL